MAQIEVFYMQTTAWRHVHSSMANCGSGNEACANVPSFTMSEIYKSRTPMHMHGFTNLTKKLYICKDSYFFRGLIASLKF